MASSAHSTIKMKNDDQIASLADLLKDIHWRHEVVLSQNDEDAIVVRAYAEDGSLVEVTYVHENGSVNATR